MSGSGYLFVCDSCIWGGRVRRVVARFVRSVKGPNVRISEVEEMSGVQDLECEAFTEFKFMTGYFHLSDIQSVIPSQSVAILEAQS